MSNVIIIGAGAAGLMSGIIAARNGNKVTILEQCDKPAKKIYATGNGRCNFTNLIINDESFRGSNPKFAYDAYSQFSNTDLIEFLNKLGVISKDINGYVYPNSEQAKIIPFALLNELKRLKVNIYTDTKVTGINTADNGFVIITNDKEYKADKLIITVGGKSSPNLGSDGSLYSEIINLGHNLIKPLPALTSLKYASKKYSMLKGVRYKCDLSLVVDNMEYKNSGEIIFNNDNINGIPIMQVSRYASLGFYNKQKVELYLDLLPALSKDELFNFVISKVNSFDLEQMTIEELLLGFLNDKLADFVINEFKASNKLLISQLSKNDIHKLVRLIKNFPIEVDCCNSFDNSQVTLGGISTDEIKDTMESTIIPNIYFAGEVIDIDGNCGGYNLQWAFTSGYIAGMLKQ